MLEKFLTARNVRWLTAYLLIALAILILAANLFAPVSSAPSATATVTPSLTDKTLQKTVTTVNAAATAVNATVTAVAKAPAKALPIDPKIYSLSINVTSQDDKAKIKKMISDAIQGDRATTYKGRQAAFIIAYINVLDITKGRSMATAVENSLQLLSTDSTDALFSGAAYQSVVFTGQETDAKNDVTHPLTPPNNVDIEIYLYQ